MFASRLVSSSSIRACGQSGQSFHSPSQNHFFTVYKPQNSTLSPSPNQHLQTLVNGFYSFFQSPNKRVGLSSSASVKKSLGDEGEKAKRGGDAKSSTVFVRDDLEDKRLEEYVRCVGQKEQDILLVVLNRLKARTRGALVLPRPPEIAIGSV